MTKESLLELADELSIEEIDNLIQTLHTIKATKLTTEIDKWNQAELEALFTSEPKSGAWIVANNPAIGAWFDMTGDTLDWSIQLRSELETHIHESD